MAGNISIQYKVIATLYVLLFLIILRLGARKNKDFSYNNHRGIPTIFICAIVTFIVAISRFTIFDPLV